MLTLSRLLIAPFLLPFLIVYYLPSESFAIHLFLTLLFIFFSLTDFFDGYFARKYKQETRLGALLDPIADKIFCFAILISLIVIGKINFFWVIFLTGRDFFVMGLRMLALEKGHTISVAFAGKVKTAFLMLFLAIAILLPPFANMMVIYFEHMLLYVSLFLSLYSAYLYYKVFIQKWYHTFN